MLYLRESYIPAFCRRIRKKNVENCKTFNKKNNRCGKFRPLLFATNKYEFTNPVYNINIINKKNKKLIKIKRPHRFAYAIIYLYGACKNNIKPNQFRLFTFTHVMTISSSTILYIM